jgi:hypothetical protein
LGGLGPEVGPKGKGVGSRIDDETVGCRDHILERFGSSPDRAPPGNGLLLFFRVDDFDEALARAHSLVGSLEQEVQVNPATGTREFALRDLDGYYVMVSALD